MPGPIAVRESRFADDSPRFTPCFHGGAFFAAIGEEFDRLERRHAVVNADVLDAWFEPSPRAVQALEAELPWLLKTSPPTQCEGLLRTVARVRGVPVESVVPGAGSSDLIHRVLPRWLDRASRVVLLDPSYGEYAHVCSAVVGARVDPFELRDDDDFELDLGALARHVARARCDLLVLVRPNNPCGATVPRSRLEAFLAELPRSTRVWIDEAYVDHLGPHESLERFAAASDRVVVCKSLSKGLALSGARAAYLVANESTARAIRGVTPPWVVGLPAQVAAVAALDDRDHYAACYAQTRVLREQFVAALAPLAEHHRFRVRSSPANWVTLHLDPAGPSAATVVTRCAARSVFVRDAGRTSRVLGTHTLRIAVRPPREQRLVLDALGVALEGNP
jgi:histidinol-phosphate/aromatic aminotransferase/cobyric acid decarboxylase-like protein